MEEAVAALMEGNHDMGDDLDREAEAIGTKKKQDEDGGEEEEEVEREEDLDEGEDELQLQEEAMLEFGPEEPLPAIMSKDDPRRMKLTREERDWALDIKDVIETIMPDIDNLPDYWYAQLALICKEDVEDAVERARALQHFREEYDIKICGAQQDDDEWDSLFKDASRRLSQHVHLFPGKFLSWSFNEREGSYVLVGDMTKAASDFSKATGSTDPREIERRLYAGTYFMLQAHCCDFETIRKGPTLLMECEGFSWQNRKKGGWATEKIVEHLWSIYPRRMKMVLFHTNMIFNVALSLVKKFLPNYGYEIGGNIDARLDTIYMVPTKEIATQRMLSNLMESLKKRFDNERSFSL